MYYIYYATRRAGEFKGLLVNLGSVDRLLGSYQRTTGFIFLESSDSDHSSICVQVSKIFFYFYIHFNFVDLSITSPSPLFFRETSFSCFTKDIGGNGG